MFACMTVASNRRGGASFDFTHAPTPDAISGPSRTPPSTRLAAHPRAPANSSRSIHNHRNRAIINRESDTRILRASKSTLPPSRRPSPSFREQNCVGHDLWFDLRQVAWTESRLAGCLAALTHHCGASRVLTLSPSSSLAVVSSVSSSPTPRTRCVLALRPPSMSPQFSST